MLPPSLCNHFSKPSTREQIVSTPKACGVPRAADGGPRRASRLAVARAVRHPGGRMIAGARPSGRRGSFGWRGGMQLQRILRCRPRLEVTGRVSSPSVGVARPWCRMRRRPYPTGAHGVVIQTPWHLALLLFLVLAPLPIVLVLLSLGQLRLVLRIPRRAGGQPA